jgi:hypothetical protein
MRVTSGFSFWETEYYKCSALNWSNIRIHFSASTSTISKDESEHTLAHRCKNVVLLAYIGLTIFFNDSSSPFRAPASYSVP